MDPLLDPRRQPAPSPEPARALPRALLGVGLLVVGIGLAIHDLANANRPHELDAAPYVCLLTGGAAFLLFSSLAIQVRAMQGRITPWRGLLLALFLMVIGLDLLVLVVSFSTSLDVLFQ